MYMVRLSSDLGFCCFLVAFGCCGAFCGAGAAASSSLESEAHSGPSKAASFFSMSLALASIFLDVGMVSVKRCGGGWSVLLALRLGLQHCS